MENIIYGIKALASLFKSKLFLVFQIIATFLLPIKGLIFLVGLMIVLDTVSGIWSAIKRKEKISSHKLSRVISKMVLYQIALITFFVLDKFLIGEFVLLFTSIPFLLTKFVAVFFCSVELMSLNENIKGIYGVNLFQMLKKILLRAKEVKSDLVEIADVKSKDEEARVD